MDLLQWACTQKPVRFAASLWLINGQYMEFAVNFKDFRFQKGI